MTMQVSKTLAVLALGCLTNLAAGAAPVEGKDYVAVNPAQVTSDPSKIVVTEFFSYQCPHCFSFAHAFDRWSKTLPADVKVERVAVSIGHESWVPAAQAFWALTAMDKVAAVDDAFFSAIHRDRVRLTDEVGIADWIGKQGINRADFTKYYRSFSVQVKTRYADEMSRRHRIPGVPTLVVDGKYLISIADDGQFDDQLKIADALIADARKGRSKN